MHQHAGGREWSTTRAQYQFITLQARYHWSNNATTLRSELQNATGVRLSTQTIRNRLHEAGLRSWRPAIHIPLTWHHVQERLEWARDHVTWALNDWTPISFTDESRFCVDFTDRLARVWRMQNERFAEVCIAEHDRYGRGSVMVWAGISAQGKTDLHVIENGTLTAERYVNEILDVHVRPYAGAIGPDFILMDDNAHAHRAPITIRYLEHIYCTKTTQVFFGHVFFSVTETDETINPYNMHGICCRKPFLLARSNQQLSGSSEKLSLRSGPSFLSISSVDLSVACDGDVRP